MEKKLALVFEAAGPEPWRKPPQSYIGLAKVERLLRLHKDGMPARKIAEELGISASTVYRNIAACNATT